jgi:hypothetical protein
VTVVGVGVGVDGADGEDGELDDPPPQAYANISTTAEPTMISGFIRPPVPRAELVAIAYRSVGASPARPASKVWVCGD